MKKIRLLFLGILFGICFCMLITIVIDPLYLYHGPILGMNEVLFDSSLQVEGTIKNFEYDSVLVGSSMIENVDVTYLNNKYNIETLKVPKESGSIADLLFYLNEIHRNNKDVKRVFLNIDLFAMNGSVEPTIPADYTPKFLFTDNILDDGKYLLNKDILFEKIPLFIAYGAAGKYKNNKSYNFAESKIFSAEGAMQNYSRQEEIEEATAVDTITIDTNITNLKKEIENHKNIEYVLFYQPYSLLWWDSVYREGKYENIFYALEKSLIELSDLENVKLYYFMCDKDIVYNLDYYMDTVHFDPMINQYIMELITDDNNFLVKKGEATSLTDKTKEMFDEIITKEIYKYYDK